jgi:O-antigen ligase
MKSSGDYSSQLLFYLLMLLVILSPLPLGSNREWAWTLCALLAAGITLLWLLFALFNARQISLKINPVLILMLLAVCLWVGVQTAAWTPAQWHHPLWRMTAGSLRVDLPGRVSVSAQDSQTALMRLLSYGLVFFVSFQLGRSKQRAFAALRILAYTGLVYAVYGLFSFWSGEGSLLWFKEEAFKMDLRSTFVNRNSYATYAGLSLMCTMAWFYQSIAVRRSNQMYEIPQGRQLRTEQFILKIWKPLTVLLLISAALILTHSRGGFISSLVAGIVLLSALNQRQKIKSASSKAVIGAAIAVAVLAFMLTSEALLQRMDRLDLDANGRVLVYELVSDSLQHGNMHGMGYGTFSDSFRMYRSDELHGHYDKAHNTYLENIFELGWPAALSLFACIAWLGLICLKGVRNRRRDWAFPATGLAATVLVGIHSLFDFSLQMPAVAITYACIMGVACAQSYSATTIK